MLQLSFTPADLLTKLLFYFISFFISTVEIGFWLQNDSSMRTFINQSHLYMRTQCLEVAFDLYNKVTNKSADSLYGPFLIKYLSGSKYAKVKCETN